MTTEPFLLQAVAHTDRAYGRFPAVCAKDAVRIAAEGPLMFAAFVLGVPMFAVIIERGEKAGLPGSPFGRARGSGYRPRCLHRRPPRSGIPDADPGPGGAGRD